MSDEECSSHSEELPSYSEVEECYLEDQPEAVGGGGSRAGRPYRIRRRRRAGRVRRLVPSQRPLPQWALLPAVILDVLLMCIPFAQIDNFMRICVRYFNHAADCYPYWRHMALALSSATSDVAHDFADVRVSARVLFRRCMEGMALLYAPLSGVLRFQGSEVTPRTLRRSTYIERITVNHQEDLFGMIFNGNMLQIHVLSTLADDRAGPLFTHSLNVSWMVQAFWIIRGVVVFWIGTRGLYPVIASMPIGGGATVTHCRSGVDLHSVTVSEEYIVALESRRPRRSGRVWRNVRQQFRFWPRLPAGTPLGRLTGTSDAASATVASGNAGAAVSFEAGVVAGLITESAAYQVMGIVRQSREYVADILLSGTRLGLLRYPSVRSFSEALQINSPTNTFPVRLEVQELGPPQHFQQLPPVEMSLSAQHASDLVLQERSQMRPVLRLINERSSFRNSSADIVHQIAVNAPFGPVISAPDYLRVGDFIISGHPYGNLLHLDRPTTQENPYLVFDVRQQVPLRHVLVDTFNPVARIRTYFFAGYFIIYEDGSRLVIRRLSLS